MTLFCNLFIERPSYLHRTGRTVQSVLPVNACSQRVRYQFANN